MINSSAPGELVYDPFCGSGTSIIAAEISRRACCAIEIEPTIVDMAVRRWQAFTGKTAVLEGDGRTFSAVSKSRGRRRSGK